MKKRKTFKMIIILISVFTSSILIAVLGLAIYASHSVDFTADEALFSASRSGNITRFFYDASGNYGKVLSRYEPIEFEFVSGAAERRSWYSYSEISPHIKNAFVATEDREFYSHHGVNIKRTLAALLNYITHNGSGFGGSTITQQVIKNISGDNERTAKRKLNEVIRAYHLEYSHSKEEIFEVYLNIVPMGENVAGVGLASQKYFGKEPDALSLSEAATLVGITNAPSKYNPYTNYDACLRKRNIILSSMLECGFINDLEYYSACAEPILLKEREASQEKINSWFVETVCDEICADLVKNNGYSYEAARILVMNGGLSVYTTLDPHVQSTLEDYFENTKNLSPEIANGLDYSMVITDSENADLRALVGSAGAKKGNRILNNATVPHVPGSALKPLALYAPLINSKKITWSTVFDDVPVEFYENDNGTYTEYPRNSPEVYDGLISVADALAYSKNTVAIRLFNLIGAENIFDNLYNNYGFDTLVRKKTTSQGKNITDVAKSPLALGQLSYGLPLRRLTEAYTAFPNEGKLCSGRSYVLCLDGNGKMLIEKKNEFKNIFSPQCARIMNQMLSRVTDIGTAARITLDSMVDVAGKTGTSGSSKDKLFVGYTPYYTAGIWCGYGDGKTSVSGQSHIIAWDSVMRSIHEGTIGYSDDVKTFSTQGLVRAPYCMDSGKRYSLDCMKDPRGSRMSYGYFIKGTEPVGSCDSHILCLYDTLAEGVVIGDCPGEYTEWVALLNIPNRSFPKQIFVTDAEYVYRSTDSVTKFGDSYDMPYFAYTIPEGEYVGISKNKKQFNSSCFIHSN